MENKEFKESRIVLTECTFFSPEHRERAKIGKHIHVDDLAELLETWNAEHVVVSHVSRRTSLGFARDKINAIDEGRHSDRVHFLMDHRGNRRRYEQQLANANKPVQKSVSAES